ncbi:hypothetical protein N7530_004276 [Penicillium desertorum]|uniref:Cyanovirin-N domain-containing protein n=1 Tax=Penicillium desertorum TaxID=1303715 RepID=A0A9W9WY78_9EURO|nr:hypothetical protein N7530_004276 [Penicillium desertorum]
MSFAATCTDIFLKDGHILACYAVDQYGSSVYATLDLNGFIGNDDGYFTWKGVNFASSAREIRLEGTLLTAELLKKSGSYRERQNIDLNDRIANENGDLVFR